MTTIYTICLKEIKGKIPSDTNLLYVGTTDNIDKCIEVFNDKAAELEPYFKQRGEEHHIKFVALSDKADRGRKMEPSEERRVLFEEVNMGHYELQTSPSVYLDKVYDSLDINICLFSYINLCDLEYNIITTIEGNLTDDQKRGLGYLYCGTGLHNNPMNRHMTDTLTNIHILDCVKLNDSISMTTPINTLTHYIKVDEPYKINKKDPYQRYFW